VARPTQTRLTAPEGRRFGVQVGTAFALLAAFLAWRGFLPVAQVLASIGLCLVLAGLLIPARLGPVYRAWMGLALLLSRVTTPIFMGITFFLVITPIALIIRGTGRNPVVRHPVSGSYWVPRAEGPGRRSDLERQF